YSVSVYTLNQSALQPYKSQTSFGILNTATLLFMRTITIEQTTAKKRTKIKAKPLTRSQTNPKQPWYHFWSWAIWRSRKFHISLAVIAVVLIVLGLAAYLAIKPIYDQSQ